MNSGKVRFLYFLSLAIMLRALLAGCGGGTVAYSQAPTAVVVTVTPVAPFVPAYAGTFVVQAGLSQQFAATVLNDPANSGVTWSVATSGCAHGCGTIDASGRYTAPMTPPDFGPDWWTQMSIVARSVADPTKTGSVFVIVTPV